MYLTMVFRQKNNGEQRLTILKQIRRLSGNSAALLPQYFYLLLFTGCQGSS